MKKNERDDSDEQDSACRIYYHSAEKWTIIIKETLWQAEEQYQLRDLQKKKTRDSFKWIWSQDWWRRDCCTTAALWCWHKCWSAASVTSAVQSWLH